jgi:hypothetical protein
MAGITWSRTTGRSLSSEPEESRLIVSAGVKTSEAMRELEEELFGVLADAGFARLEPDVDRHAAVAVQDGAGEDVFPHRTAGHDHHLQRAVEDVDGPRLEVVIRAGFGDVGDLGAKCVLVASGVGRAAVELRFGDFAIDQDDGLRIDDVRLRIVRTFLEELDGRRLTADIDALKQGRDFERVALLHIGWQNDLLDRDVDRRLRSAEADGEERHPLGLGTFVGGTHIAAGVGRTVREHDRTRQRS